MRTTLVLTDETARHPFLASLPPHVRKGAEPQPMPRRRWLTRHDVRDFLMAYCACFMATTAFIA